MKKFDKEENEMYEVKDFLGNILKKEDDVIFVSSYRRTLRKGKIFKINPKTVTIHSFMNGKRRTKTILPEYVYKINEKDNI